MLFNCRMYWSNIFHIPISHIAVAAKNNSGYAKIHTHLAICNLCCMGAKNRYTNVNIGSGWHQFSWRPQRRQSTMQCSQFAWWRNYTRVCESSLLHLHSHNDRLHWLRWSGKLVLVPMRWLSSDLMCQLNWNHLHGGDTTKTSAECPINEFIAAEWCTSHIVEGGMAYYYLHRVSLSSMSIRRLFIPPMLPQCQWQCCCECVNRREHIIRMLWCGRDW